MFKLLLAGATGAALMYFLDPDRGRRRRHMTRDRLAAKVRRGARQVARTGRVTASEAYGMAQRMAHPTIVQAAPPNDVTLAHKVESELFRDPDVPKGQINVNAEHGRVVLRGQLDHPEQISAIEEAVRKIPGVAEVENLLHLRRTSAASS